MTLGREPNFDPSSNDVTLVNTGRASTILVIGGGRPDSPEQQETRVYPSSVAQLGPGQWDISTYGCTTKMLDLHRRFLPPSKRKICPTLGPHRFGEP